MRLKDGYTRRQHLESAARQGSVGAKLELAGPVDLPPLAAHVWDYFCQIGEARASGMGISAIAWSEIAAWQGVTGIRLRPHERDWVRALDRAFIDANAKGNGDGGSDDRGAP